MTNPKSQIPNPKVVPPGPPWGVKGGFLCWDLGFVFWDFRHDGKEVAVGH